MIPRRNNRNKSSASTSASQNVDKTEPSSRAVRVTTTSKMSPTTDSHDVEQEELKDLKTFTSGGTDDVTDVVDDIIPMDLSPNGEATSSTVEGGEMGLTTPREDLSPLPKSVPKSGPTSGRTSKTSSVSSHVIDYDIKRWGYTAVQRIDITKKNDKVQTLIKARSPLGFFVFIEVDNGTYSGSTNQDITMTEKGMTLPISTTMKRGIADNFPHSSAAIVCNQGICKLEWDPEKVEPVEVNYTITSKHGYSNILPENSVIAFPIVKYSELKNNPNLVLELTLSATKNNREMSTSQCEETYKQLISRTNNFFRNAAEFLEFRRDKVSELSSSLRALTEEQRELVERTNLSLGDQERVKVLSYNLGHRNDLALSYFEVRKTIQRINDDISDLTQRIDLLNAMFRAEFVNLDKELEPPNL